GYLLLWTYAAVIAGQAAGGALLDGFRETRWAIGLVLGCITLVSVGFALLIPRVPVARTEGGLRVTAREGWRAIRQITPLRLGFIGNLWYWSLAALLSQDLIVYAKSVLGVSDAAKSALIAAMAVGVGLGSLLAGFAARGRIALVHIPLGAAGMAAMAALIGILAPGFTLVMWMLVLLGVAGGFFVVPINALIQHHAPVDERGGVLAVMNIIIFLGIIGGSGTAWILSQAGLSSTSILLVAAGVTASGAVYATLAGRRYAADF
ncbi:MAG: MFS transporter, partial [Planctomycetota bacterium]